MIEASESNANPNVNCLQGKRCPKCGSYGPFEVSASVRVLLYDSGTQDSPYGTTEFDDEAPARCCGCLFDGRFGEFDELNKVL